MPKFSVMIVDDDAMTLKSLERVLSGNGLSVETAGDAETALSVLVSRPFDLALFDINLPGMDGIGLLRELRDRGVESDVVMMTAFATLDSAVSALRLGATDYILKPFELDQLMLVVDRLVERKRLVCDNLEFSREARDQYDFSRIVTRNPEFLSVLDSLKRVCATTSAVLITGESGVGKELVARAIHNNSDRADRPLIAVNCGAIPPTLMEAEFFGHVKGAFTGAVRDRRGFFERADGSTLFLDEVGELPPDLQVKLLRALQERQVTKLGDGRVIDVDFRLIAATQRDLGEDIKEGRFRQDLYYRLHVVPVHVPPLRDRPEDVRPLVELFLSKSSRKGITISDEALAALGGYSWPGNVRELENVVERATVMAESDAIGLCDLPSEIQGEPAGIKVGIPAHYTSYKQVVKEVTDLALREVIARALNDNDWNVTRSAKALEISRRQLIYKMHDLGLGRNGLEPEES